MCIGCVYVIEASNVDIDLFPMTSWVSVWVSERMRAAERASEASSAEQGNEWAVQASEWGGANGPVLYASISLSFNPLCSGTWIERHQILLAFNIWQLKFVGPDVTFFKWWFSSIWQTLGPKQRRPTSLSKAKLYHPILTVISLASKNQDLKIIFLQNERIYSGCIHTKTFFILLSHVHFLISMAFLSSF